MSEQLTAQELHLRNLLHRLLNLYVKRPDGTFPSDPFIDHCRALSRRIEGPLNRPLSCWEC